jgi:N-sulfoglucosamine sulfohydrolase
MKNTFKIYFLVVIFNILPNAKIIGQNMTLPKPNIVWLVSEDNCPYIGVYGDKVAKTPNIDKLAETGVVYDNAFSNAPVCAPSRNTIITGMYSNSLGNQQMRSRYKAPSFVKLFPQYLKDAGYYTANCKKEDYNISMETHPWSAPWDESSATASYKNRKPGQPFFYVKNFGITHESQLFDSIPDEKLNFKPADMVVFPYHPNTPDFRHDYAQYYYRINQLDTQIGEVLDDLKKQGLYENTIVFYYSDHGGVLPRGKRYLFESGLHVPMIIHVPEMYKHLMPDKIGTHSDRVISFVDLAPSLLNLAGIKIPKYMQGQAFLGENVAKSKEYAFGFRGRMDEKYDLMHSARNKQYRYIRNYYPERVYGQYLEYLWKSRAIRNWEKLDKEGKLNNVQSAYWKSKPYEELYDIVKDPHNVNNLAKDPKYAKVLAKMSKATNNWIAETRPLDVFPEPMMVDIDKKVVLYDSINGSNYPLMKIHEVARMSARAAKSDFNTLFAYTKDTNPVIAFWGIKAMFQYPDEMKSEDRKIEIRKNLSRPELYLQNLTANLLLSLGDKPDCTAIITNGINSNNVFNRLEGLLLYQTLGRNDKLDAIVKHRYESIKGNLYEQSVMDVIYGVVHKAGVIDKEDTNF